MERNRTWSRRALAAILATLLLAAAAGAEISASAGARELRWSERFEQPWRAMSFAAEAGRAFTVVDTEGGFLLRACDVLSGAELWRADEAAAVTPTRIAARGDFLIVAGDVGAAGSWLRVYDAASGRALWEERSSGRDAAHRTTALAVGDGRVFHATSVDDGLRRWELRAYDATSGELVWSRRGAPDLYGRIFRLTAADGTVFAWGEELDRIGFVRAWSQEGGSAGSRQP